MRTIYKYPINIGKTELLLPAGYSIKHIGLDPNGEPCVWVLVQPAYEEQKLKIEIFGTGHALSGDMKNYIGSFNQGPFVWHAFSS